MSNKPKFQWDADALTPDVVKIDFAKLTGTKDAEVITFYEFSRTELTDFVAGSLELKIFETEPDGSVKKDAEGVDIRKKFSEVADEHSAFIFKALATATRSEKDEKFFADLPITAKGMAALVDMLLKLNHVDEVLATSGNWLMLPTVMEILGQAADAKSNESESQRTTSEA